MPSNNRKVITDERGYTTEIITLGDCVHWEVWREGIAVSFGSESVLKWGTLAKTLEYARIYANAGKHDDVFEHLKKLNEQAKLIPWKGQAST